MIGKTFEQARGDPEGTIYADWQDGEYRCLVMRGPICINAYVGVRPDSGLYGAGLIPVSCHGGLSFSEASDDSWPEGWPRGYHWFGWDYAHAGDVCFFDNFTFFGDYEHAWTPDEVAAEIPAVVEQLRQIEG